MENESAVAQAVGKTSLSMAERNASDLLDLLMPVAIDPETPARMVKALYEMTEGYRQDPMEILSKQFPSSADGIVVLQNIRFSSVCEHHVLPFVGTASVGYIPNGRIVGLSKLARVTECFARRLQVQERLTEQIANAVEEALNAKAVGVIMKAQHQCMACRGVRQTDAVMVTSCVRGIFENDSSARNEFLKMT